MPSKVITWKCNICNRVYKTEEQADDCELRGIPMEYPIGMIIADHRDRDHIYSSITFAICRNSIEGHVNYTSGWACRSDKYHGDTLGDIHCSIYSHMIANGYRINPDHPTFGRMVQYLESQNIPITVWDGIKPVPLNKYLKRVVALIQDNT